MLTVKLVSGMALLSLLGNCAHFSNPNVPISDTIEYTDLGPSGAHWFHFFPNDSAGNPNPEGDVSYTDWNAVEDPDPSGVPSKAHRIGYLCFSPGDIAKKKGELGTLCSYTGCTEDDLALVKRFFDKAGASSTRAQKLIK